MLEIYSGIPGSGKTLEVTKIAVKEMRKGRPVFSNYPIQCKVRKGFKLYTVTSYILTKDMLTDYVFPYGSLLIIDEAQTWFGSREWKDFSKDSLLLFTAHRHIGYSLICICQHPQRVDVILRELANMFWLVDRNLFFTVFTGYYEFSDYGKRKKDFPNMPIKRKLSFFRSRYYKNYDTFYMKDRFSHLPKVVPVAHEQFKGVNYNIENVKLLFISLKNRILSIKK